MNKLMLLGLVLILGFAQLYESEILKAIAQHTMSKTYSQLNRQFKIPIEPPRRFTCAFNIHTFRERPDIAYKCSVIASENDKHMSLILLPFNDLVKHVDNDGVRSSQCSARISGRIKCPGGCGLIQLVLQSTNTSEIPKVLEFYSESCSVDFRFENIREGNHKLMLQNNKMCWFEKTFQVNIINKDIEGLHFVHSGYAVPCNLSHDALVIFDPLFQNSGNITVNFEFWHGLNVQTEVEEKRSITIHVRRFNAGTDILFIRPEDQDVTISMSVQDPRPSPAVLYLQSLGEFAVELLKQGTHDANFTKCIRMTVTHAFEASFQLLDENEHKIPIEWTESPSNLVELLFSGPKDEHHSVRIVSKESARNQSDMLPVIEGRLVSTRKTTSYLPWLNSDSKKSSKAFKIKGYRLLITSV